MRIDLHIHSSTSDGALAPDRLVQRARAGGLDLVAVADHDTVDGVAPARAAAPDGLTVLSAIEVSASHRGRDIHILGYGVDADAPVLLDYTDRARRARADRIRAMIDRLADLDVHVTFEEVAEEAGPDARVLARPHLARVLSTQGVVGSIAQAFDRFIGDDGPAFVPTELADVPQAIQLIRDAGGVAVWAHPPLPLLGGALREFVDAGLQGLECYRPRVGPQDLNRLLNKARHHQLLVTGGSDWHGDWHGELGAFHIDRPDVEAFLDRLGL